MSLRLSASFLVVLALRIFCKFLDLRSVFLPSVFPSCPPLAWFFRKDDFSLCTKAEYSAVGALLLLIAA